MKFSEFELFIENLYNEVKVKDITINNEKISTILRGHNYKLNNLFLFLEKLNYILLVQNIVVYSTRDLALILRNERKKRSITRLQMLTEIGLNFNTINKIESGKNHQKETLKKYLNYFPDITFELQKNTGR